jgi:RHS repeat-associated protein
MRVSSRLIGFVACIFTLCPSLFAQNNPNLENGLVPFGAYDGGDFDSINLYTGNLALHIPLFNYPQRGTLPGQIQIVGNTKSFYVVQTCNTQLQTCTLRWNIPPTLGPQITQVSDTLGVQAPYRTSFPNGIHVVSWDGSSHQMIVTNAGTLESLDASGIWANNQFPPTAFLSKNGNGVPSASGSMLERDTNGNYFNGTLSSYTDTLGRTITTTSYPGPNGNPTQVQITSANITIQTNFQASNYDMYGNFDTIQEYGPYSATLVQSIAVYNGTSWATSPTWSFQYNDRDPGDPSNINYGNVTQITLPTGGTISYAYATFTLCGTSPLTPVSRGVTSRTANANDGTGPHTTTEGGLVIDPLGNETVHTFTGLGGSCSYYETQTQYYQGSHTSGHLMKTVQTAYTYQNNPETVTSDDSAPTVVSVLPTTITTTLDNGLVSKVVNVWDTNLNAPIASGLSYGNLLEKQEYAYGSGAPGPLLRKTDYTYLAFNNSQYLALNMLDRVASVTVYDGSGSKVSQTTYGYDETSPVASGVSTNLLPLPPGTLRGNQTSACRWLNTTGGTLCTYTTYYDTGMPYQVTDPRGNVTTYNYSSTYAGAYVTQTTMPQTGSVLHVTSGTYDFGTGKLTSFTDQNGKTSNYQYDALWRMTTASFPDGGQTTFSYPDLVTVQRQKKINNSLSRTDVSIFDALARPIQTQLTSDPQGTIFTDTTYDILGRVATVSNPYRSGTDITSSAGITTYGYDALSRKTTETYPDQSVLTTAYCGPTTLVTDPTPHWRRSTTDALGRLVEVDEPNAVGASVASTGCPGSGEPIWVTSYGYDALGNLTSVLQNGSHQRSFTYDSLSRLLASSNPEVGTITYKYDSDTNCPSPNSFPTVLVSRTDARGTRTCYQYDALNRETVRNYSNSDPTVTTTYDQTNCLGLSSCANVGHRTSMTDAAGSESWSYDVVDRIHKDQRMTNSITKSATYYLDYAGNITSAVYPTGRTVNYAYDAANRPSSAIDGSNGITYATGFKTSPGGTCLTNVTCYTPQGTFYALSIGQSSALTNGLNLTHTYNNRLQPLRFNASTGTSTNVAATAAWASHLGRSGWTTQITFTTPSPTDLSIGKSVTASGWTPSFISGNYVVTSVIDSTHFWVVLIGNHGSGTAATGNLTFVPSAIDITYYFIGGGNAGHVYYIFNNLDPTRTQHFTYDQLSRLIAAQTVSTYASNPAHCWGEIYNVDAWGNLQSIAATTDTNYTGCSQESGFSTTADGNNHLPIFSYDASGNTQNDGTYTYNWDAESQLKSATTSGTTTNYTYDGDGRRVAKVGSKLYWYGSGGDILAETDASGNTTAEYIFFGGKRIAMLPASGTPLYYVEDMLGTSRVITTNTGVVCYDADFYPYGGERSYTNTCPQNYKFEGKERDAETGNDDFGARYYSNRFGRWLSADWSSVPVPVPYANLANPQTLNLYAMVADDPESFADLDGHCNPSDPNGCGGGQFSDFIPAVWLGSDQEGPSQKQQKDPPPATAKFGIGIEVPDQSAVNNNVLDVSADPGHAFAYIKNASGTIVSILSFGPGEQIGASNKNDFKAGKLSGDAHWQLSGNVSTWEFNITAPQMTAGLQAMTNTKTHVPNYTPSVQCTSVALSIGAKAGVNLPNGIGPVTAKAYGIMTIYNGNAANPYHLNKQMIAAHGAPTVVNSNIFPTP